MKHHLLCASSSLLLVMFLFSSILVTSQFPFGSNKQAYNYSNVTSYIESERQALLQFKDGLLDESNHLSSWIGEDYCSWKGVGCHQTIGSVLKLNLRNMGPFDDDDGDHYCRTCLEGQLSSSLVNLTNLKYLDRSLNNFSGIQVPTFLGLLKNLRYLDLSNAGFDGEIPCHLGNLSHLLYLGLGYATESFSLTWNRLRTKDLEWVAGLSSLTGLVLSGVDLSAIQDGFQTINMFPSLTTLNLYKCRLVIIPHLSPINFASLSSFNLGENTFSHYIIPLWIHNLTSLHDLDLSSNNLFGPIHGLFEQMTSLVHLDLGENYFDVSTLKSLCNMSRLTYLDLSVNDLQGSIPTEIGQLPRLTMLSLSGNNLHGSIPTNLWQLSTLQVLDISANSLTGVLSEDHFAKLGELKSLDLSGNLLNLNVSSSWVPPFQLREIVMPSIRVGPQFPAWLRTQKEVEVLNMQNVSISDAIPNWFRVFCYNLISFPTTT